MLGYLRASLWLLVLTLVLCSFVYPLALWAIGRAPFLRLQAEGSLLPDEGGNVVGSRLIGQDFKGPQYFQPRPSFAGDKPYNAAASGATNWGASHYLLRDRVARQLGPMVKYRNGQPVGPDIESWFQQQPPDFVAQWAHSHSGLVEQWVKDNPQVVAGWLKKDEDEVKANPAESGKAFFESFTKAHPGNWPSVEDKPAKHIEPVDKGDDIRAYFFDLWRQAHPQADLEPVPADMVMASASGLDPHITLKNARYQLERVAAAWVDKTKADPIKVRQEIERILEEKKHAPLGGLVGEPLVNVLEANLALAQRMPRLALTTQRAGLR
jgi:K+-transporting ATPase ATPase C chain